MSDAASEFRHSMRGIMNAIKLCTSALDMQLERQERLDFLADIASSADQIVVLLDRWDASDASMSAPSETQ